MTAQDWTMEAAKQNSMSFIEDDFGESHPGLQFRRMFVIANLQKTFWKIISIVHQEHYPGYLAILNLIF